MGTARGCGYLLGLVNVLKLMVPMHKSMNILKATETLCFKWANCTVGEYISVKLLESTGDIEQRPGPLETQVRVALRERQVETRAPGSWRHRG